MDRQGCGSQSGVLQVNVIKAVGTLGLPEGHVPPATHWRRHSRLPTVSSESATTLGTRPPAHPARPPGTRVFQVRAVLVPASSWCRRGQGVGDTPAAQSCAPLSPEAPSTPSPGSGPARCDLSQD